MRPSEDFETGRRSCGVRLTFCVQWAGVLIGLLLLAPLFCWAIEDEVDREDRVGQAGQVGAVPLWELRLFSGIATIPHYRGSDESTFYAVPLPYLVYRGEFIEVDRGGVRGIFLKTEQWETDISLSGNPPVDGDNEAREGMPDLNGIFEAGPALKWFFTGRHPIDELYLRLAARAAISVDIKEMFQTGYQGLRGGLNLIYANGSLLKEIEMGFGFNIGVDLADSDLNAYFYEVRPEYVRDGRPGYEADAGYAGASFSANIWKQLTRTISVGAYGRWDNIDGTVFEDSPLVREKNTFILGAALTWTFWESKLRLGLKPQAEP